MISLNAVKFGDVLGGGSIHKDGTAAEYQSSGSNYRTYKPSVAPTAEGGLYILPR